MARKKDDDCQTLVTICLTGENTDTVETYQAFIKKRENKSSYSKDQAINRIIKEWAEDRSLTLEVKKK